MFNNSINYSFRHSKIALLTKHKKEIEIIPLIKNYLGTEIEVFDCFDTDELGTFTREKKRNQSQLETARFKAKKAIEISGCQIGIGSEGSFTTDPYMGLVPWNIEMIVLYDYKNNVEIVGTEQRPFKSIQKLISTKEELISLIKGIDFPKNNLILRPNSEDDRLVKKDFLSKDELFNEFNLLLEKSINGVVFVENDHRAHRSISRMEAIRYATIDLIIKCHSFCPECSSPGFSVNRGEGNLPCRYCGCESDAFKYLVYKCNKCSFEKRIERQDIANVDQQYCNYCNP